MELNLKGKKCLITGGSHGIGLAIKKELEKEGVKVISWSRREGVDLMVDIPEFPRVDILINNVGGMGTCGITEYMPCMRKNYGITHLLTEEFLLQKRKWGRVITISSIYGKEKGPNPGFTAAKAAQIAYMKSMAGSYPGITFNTICPGYIDVGKKYKVLTTRIPGKPEYVAGIVAFLCSDKAKWINGSCITVDNGESHSF
jgi:3-oxoacyl-[acyl-carrier protein] reductase